MLKDPIVAWEERNRQVFLGVCHGLSEAGLVSRIGAKFKVGIGKSLLSLTIVSALHVHGRLPRVFYTRRLMRPIKRQRKKAKKDSCGESMKRFNGSEKPCGIAHTETRGRKTFSGYRDSGWTQKPLNKTDFVEGLYFTGTCSTHSV